jgi:monovalent cation:H+ antiporter-2, CPA2 family
VEWVRLPESGSDKGGSGEGVLLGRTIGDLGVRSETGASVLAVVRGEKVIPNPGADLQLEPGDAVGILGTPEQRAAFRALPRQRTQDDAAS